MCVICHKAKGVRLPDAKTIRSMWDENPDGAGVMWREGGKVRYVKGFMDEDEFMKWIEASREALDDTECAIHFRITTHGGTNRENCHPFPLDKRTDPHSLSGRCRAVLMHNGIMPLTPRDKKYSDTAEYSMRAKESGDPAKYIKSTAEWVAQSNRLCVFLPRETLLVGDWKKRKGDECDYSNLHFDEPPFRGFFGSSYGGVYDDGWRLCDTGAAADLSSVSDYRWCSFDGTWRNRMGEEVDFWEIDPRLLSPKDELEYYDQLNEYEEERWYYEEERKRNGEEVLA